MPDNAFARQDGEVAIPAVKCGGQLGARVAVRSYVAGYQQRSEGTFDGLAEPEDHGVRVGQGYAQGVGQFRPVQSVAIGELQQFPVTVGESAGRRGDQHGQFAVPGHRVGPWLVRCPIGKVVGNLFAVTVTEAAHRLVAGDRVQPRAELVGLAERRQARRRDTEHVLHAVGGGFAVPYQSQGEVVQAVGVAVIDAGQRLTITPRSGAGQFGVAGVVPTRHRPGHDAFSSVSNAAAPQAFPPSPDMHLYPYQEISPKRPPRCERPALHARRVMPVDRRRTRVDFPE